MKTKIRVVGLGLIICASATVLFFSCQKSLKDQSASQGVDVQSQKTAKVNTINAANNANINDDYIFSLVMENESTAASDLKSSCPVRTYIPSKNVYPHTVMIDFGSGCTDQFGRVKKGKITTTYSAPISTPGSASVTTFDSFYIDDANVSGRYLIENVTVNGDTYPHFSHLSNRILTYPDGEYSKEISNKLFVQTEGANTAKHSDDGYTISGQSTGVIFSFNLLTSYTGTIDPNHLLHNTVACEFPDAGIENSIIYVSNTLLATASLDYGNGTCDNEAVVSTNGISVHVTLPLKLWPF